MSDIPAFPTQIDNHAHYGTQGMTLRDYFAASVVGHLCVSSLRQDMTTEDDASYAYRVADAMLKAREE